MSAELSLGFEMALARNETAMHQFERLNETEKPRRNLIPFLCIECHMKR